LGLSEGWLKDLLSLLKMNLRVQNEIKKGNIAGRTALEAHRFGGDKMVITAAKHGMPVHTISKMAQRIRQIPDKKIQNKLKAQVMKGKILESKDLDKKASKILKTVKVKLPEDFDKIVVQWTSFIEDWNAKSDDMVVYRKFLNKSESGIEFKEKVNQLLKKLSKIV